MRYPLEIDPAKLHSGYHLYRKLARQYADVPLIARIGYPASASEPLQRLVTVKEMLHIFDNGSASALTMTDVRRLICDLLVQEAEQEIGMPAAADHNGVLNSLRMLMPRAALDIIRPAYTSGAKTVEEIAQEA